MHSSSYAKPNKYAYHCCALRLPNCGAICYTNNCANASPYVRSDASAYSCPHLSTYASTYSITNDYANSGSYIRPHLLLPCHMRDEATQHHPA